MSSITSISQFLPISRALVAREWTHLPRTELSLCSPRYDWAIVAKGMLHISPVGEANKFVVAHLHLAEYPLDALSCMVSLSRVLIGINFAFYTKLSVLRGYFVIFLLIQIYCLFTKREANMLSNLSKTIKGEEIY